MKKLAILVSIFILIGCKNNESYLISVDKLQPQEKHLLLMHPTVNNIRIYEYLIKNKIFPIPDDYIAIGVYHSQEKFDYNKTDKYLKQEGITNVRLVRIDDQLSPENIYRENACTDTFKKLFEHSNGAIFFGGPDIPAACYGEATNLLTVITDPYRHYMELSFLFHLLGGSQDSSYVPLLKSRSLYPILGICLGMQSINVATGGTMVQDIPTEIYKLRTVEDVIKLNPNQRHRNYQTNYGTDDEVTSDNYHQISIEKGTTLVSYLSCDTIHPYVLSSHHQCLKKLGKGIIVIARSMDGKIVESITHSEFKNVLGVQFHPEVNNLYKSEEKIKEFPFKKAEHSYLDLHSGDKGENFQRSIWKEFASKFN